ncbi:DUF6119 family protein [Pseudomonas rhodesiae]|jgi:uncharacterized protein (TIGR04141 family)|uniref:DUF6119 family protein n=1 Tax=Pseudomonas rhodesiae TaxID=76760 RepID=UPI002649ECF8|nr:DUF6119 family protein [Pseudomonas rhodesiae]MDN6864176.1 TIGR04141 family sporadically distributed protein [Pseudomonas rhodesiae]
MAALNIFKIYTAQLDNLVESLTANNLTFVQEIGREHEEKRFNLRLFFTQSAYPTPIKWTADLAKNFQIEEKSTPHYAAAVIVTFDDQAFVLSYGSAHFYISKFSDLDFGIDIASRLLSSFKIKSSQEFSGSRLRSIDTYKIISDLAYEAGEAVDYIRGIPADITMWGRNISCGHSVHLRHRKFGVENCHLICQRLVRVLEGDIVKQIPRRIMIHQQDVILQQDQKLIEAIENDLYMADISPTQLSGVALMFPEERDYVLRTPKQRFVLNDELELTTLRTIAREDFDGDYEALFNATVAILGDDGETQITTLKDILDYKDEEGYYLEGGRWHRYDLTYLNTIRQEVNRIDTRFSIEMPLFNYEAFEIWKGQQTGRVKYAERFVNVTLAENFGYCDGDRDLSSPEGATVEVADLFKDETIFIVKIGEPQKLNYAIDQAMASLSVLERSSFIAQVNGTDFYVKQVCLWLFIERQTDIERLSDLNSLIFLTKLANWRKFTLLRGRIPIVNISYRRTPQQNTAARR